MDRNKSVNVTVSQGIALAGASMQSHVELVKGAEQALSEARAAGFDQVRIIEPPAEPSQSSAA
jgi:PleD family two-component response regulator